MLPEECNELTTSSDRRQGVCSVFHSRHIPPESFLEKTILTSLQSAFKSSSHGPSILFSIALFRFLYAYVYNMMTSVSQRNPNKRQVVDKLRAARRTSFRSSKKGGFVSIIASTMTNLVLVLAFMLLAFSPTSSLAEFTNDALEIGDTHAILEQSKVRSLFGFFLKPDRNYYHDTR